MNNIITYYNDIAKIYDENRFNNTYGDFIDKQERKILNKLLINNNDIVLDLACGSGRLLNYADFGVDASIEMIKIAKEKFPEKQIEMSDAETTNFESNSIDTIISFHFFMHLNKEKIEKILFECNRILKPNGRIIFEVPSKKRRNLFKFKSENWHGSFSSNFHELNKINSNFTVKNSYGLLFIPIHRLPKGFRNIFMKLDYILANSFLKEYSSYIIIELLKK
jgi:ubiquinone/menaquinone biosynthesis C-methylase UbiE